MTNHEIDEEDFDYEDDELEDEEEDDDNDKDDEDEDDEDEEDEDGNPKPLKPKTRRAIAESINYSKVERPYNPNLPKNYYFDNDYVESLLTEYVQGGCCDIGLRDEIMLHAEELIKQIIRTHKLHQITYGKEGSAFADLYQTAWMQLESVLYKFDHRPGHTKVFNLWSQVAKTVMLAHIKKESRDRRNYGSYKEHVDSKRLTTHKFNRFLEEAREVCKHNKDFVKILESLEELFDKDNRPYDGLIDKLSKESGMSRAKINSFLRQIRLRSYEFTDSPFSTEIPQDSGNKYRVIHTNYEADDE